MPAVLSWLTLLTVGNEMPSLSVESAIPEVFDILYPAIDSSLEDRRYLSL